MKRVISTALLAGVLALGPVVTAIAADTGTSGASTTTSKEKKHSSSKKHTSKKHSQGKKPDTTTKQD